MKASRYYLYLSIATAFLLFIVFRLWAIDLNAPMGYNGDSLLGYTLSKGISENGWYLSNPMLGAPEGMYLQDYPLFDALQLFLIKLIGYFCSTSFLAVNLYYFLGFFLTAFSASIVLKNFGISNAVSFVFSLLYAFQSYHYLRGVEHLFLSGYFMLPLASMVVLWIYDGKDFFKPTKKNGLLNSIRNLNNTAYIAFIILFVLSLTGIYYTFFISIFIIFAGLSSALIKKEWKPILVSFGLIAVSFFGLLLQALPTLYYKFAHGTNHEVAPRYPSESEIYAFKPIQLLLPTTDHPIRFFSMKAKEYMSQVPTVNENRLSSIGLIGSCVLVFLILILLFPKIKEAKSLVLLKDRLSQLSKLSFLGILYGTMGGLAMIMASWGFFNIRSVNRISILIAFFTLFAGALLVDNFLKTRKTYTVYGVLLLLLSFGLFDQTPASIYKKHTLETGFNQEKKFFKDVEKKYSGCQFFQLPYLAFPESSVKAGWTDYGHFKAYLHTNTVKWSYGTMRGRPADLWQKNTAQLKISEMVPLLKKANFDGIYLDKAGVEDSTLIPSLEKALGSPDLISKNSALIIYRFK